MTAKHGSQVTSIGLALALAMAGPAQAGNEFVGGLVGGVIGGIIGSQIGQQQNRKSAPKTTNRPKRSTPARPALTAEQVEEQRRIQITLNAIGCDVGNADGVFGSKTRAGIRCFQAKVSQPQTGTLTPDERRLLLEKYASLQSGGGVSAGAGAGALFATLGAQTGNAIASPPPVPLPAEPVTPVAAVAGSAGTGAAVAANANAVTGTGAADICDGTASSAAIALPGLSPAVTTAPVFVGDVPAIGFCDLRAALIARATESVQSLGVALSDASAQCQALGDLLTEETAAIGIRPPADVIAAASATIGPAVSDYDAAVTSARLCAGIAYEQDDIALAESIALFGAAVGDPSLVEAVGWHLSFALGREADRPAAATWLREAADQMDEIDPTLLLMPNDGRRENLLAVAEVLDPLVKPASFVLPGLKN